MNIKPLIILLAVTVAACEPHVKPDGSGGGNAGTGNESSAGAQVGSISTGDADDASMLAGKEYTISYAKGAIDDPNNILSNKIIYFAYDSSQIREDYVELVKHHGKYLALHSDENIRLEGHTDERGSREYNIALADRRAQAVQRLLLFQGASADQVTIISYGEEKPAVMGHDEESWSLNRRAALVYGN
jgi:peptidoglycan-associated lipoprotein